MATPDRQSKPPTANSEQQVQNWSFDEKYKVLVVEPLYENEAGNALVRPSLNSVNLLAGYHIMNIDDSTSTSYFGFENKEGNWYIMREVSGAYRYFAGDTDYATNWTNRAGLSYDSYNIIF